jgi:patatin-like phospholipase/acyl hydrolase
MMHSFYKKTLKFVNKALIILVNGLLILSALECQRPLLKDPTPKRRLIKILSIDGGGVRGIIPALILENLESRLKKKKHLSECFDVMAGASTGGLIVLMLNKQNATGNPQYTASFIAKFYKTFGEHVFERSFFDRLFSLDGWFGAKYPGNNMQKLISVYLENTEIKDAFTNVFIPAYDINLHRSSFFSKHKAQKDFRKNYYMKDVVRATSAAPTYFTPATIKNVSGTQKRTFIDGGVVANNPTLAAYVHALELYGHQNDFLIISIGTGSLFDETTFDAYSFSKLIGGGKVDWARDIVDALLHAGSDTIHYQMLHMFTYNTQDSKFARKYSRFQPTIHVDHSALDNASPENMLALENYSINVIEQYESELQKIAELIDN